METISIIIPIYNAEATLEKCVRSILNQTYPNLEIILVNDGSTDSSLAICRQFAVTDARVEVITSPNGGVSKARNLGLAHAKGQYVGFVDSDDWVEPDFCMRLLQGMKLSDDICISVVGMVDDGWDAYLSKLCNKATDCILSNSEAVDEITKREGLRGYLCNKLFLNTSLRLDESIFVCEDLEFVLRYLTNYPNMSLAVENACLYHYIKPAIYRFSYVRYELTRSYTRLAAYHLILGYIDNPGSPIRSRIRGYLCEYSFEMLVYWYNLPRKQRNKAERVEKHIDEIHNEFILNYEYGYKVASRKMKVKYSLARHCPQFLICLLRIKDLLGIKID